MTKSISKKILSFLLITLSALAFFVPAIFGSSVDALAQFESSYDAQKEYSADELNDRLDALKTDIATIKEEIGDKVTVDENDEAYNYLVTAISYDMADSSTDLNEIAERYLFGNTGLNGLYGIYETANNFYNRYVAVDGNGKTEVAVENDLNKEVNATLIEEAKVYLSQNFKAKSYESKDFDKTLVDAKVAEFEAGAVENAKTTNKTQDDVLAVEVAKVNYYREIYFGDKYGNAYANQTLYESETDVSVEKAQEVIAEMQSIYETETSFEVAMTKVRVEVAKYIDGLKTLKSCMERAYEEVLDTKASAETAEAKKELLAKCESAFEAYSNLGTIVYYEKNADGEDILYSLKDLRPENSDNKLFEGDREVARKLLVEYKDIVKDAVAKVAIEKESDYGLSGGTLISKYRNYAKALADCLGECGLLPEEESAPVANYTAKKYSYGSVTVENGSDIVKAFEDSFTVDGALQVTDNGSAVRSESLEDKKLTSSITVKDSAETPKYEVTLTCMDGDTPKEFFDSGAVLRVREGATPSIERNINLLLSGDKVNEVASKIDETTRATLKGKIVRYYFTVTVLEPNELDGIPAVKEIKDTGYTFVLTIKFLDKTELAEIKDKTSVIKYRHTTVEEVYNITWGEDTIMFNVTDFTNEAQMAIISTGTPMLDNIITYAVFGLGGLIVLLFLIWILVAVIKNWRYKITFYARGGKYNKRIKVKLREKFNHPAPPRRKGYKFLGWYADSKCTVKFAATELTKRKNIKVYAKWISNAEYAKLEEKYANANANATVVAGVPVVVDAKKDPQIEKIEAEKLGYEAKKAEEERKTEEVKLQAIREIEQAKKNEEALAKAEQDAKDAQNKLDEALAERDERIKEARADERTKCLEEIKAVNADNTNVEDYEEAIAKARDEASQETEDRLRKEYDEKADEQARINAEYAERIKALEEANARAEAEAKARDEADAKRQAEEEERIQLAIAAGLAAKLAENEVAKETEAVAEPVVEEVEEVEEVVEETPAFDTDTVFDNIKAEVYSYTDASDLGYTLEANVPACAMKVVGETIELEVNLDLADCEKKGYKVVAGEKLPVKFVLTSEDDVDEAYELVEETMFVNGLRKTKKAVITKATDETRANGFEYGVSSDRVADTPEEFYKLLRVYAQSFVLADDGEVENKALVKMFLARGKVYMYLNYTAEGLNACDEEMANDGYKTFMTVKNADDCRNAIKAISAMMKENGLIRYPSQVSVADDDCKRGFTYTLSK